MVLKVSFARKLFSTLVAFARNFKISVPKIEYQHARALSYGSQGFICKEIIFHIGCNCQQLSNQRAENIVNIHVHMVPQGIVSYRNGSVSWGSNTCWRKLCCRRGIFVLCLIWSFILCSLSRQRFKSEEWRESDGGNVNFYVCFKFQRLWHYEVAMITIVL